MKAHSRKESNKTIQRIILIAAGVLVNVLLSYITSRLGIPLYFDTIGTIVIASMGFTLPGIFTAVLTSVIYLFYNPSALYFSSISALIAIFTSWYFGKKSTKKIGNILVFTLIVAVFAGVGSSAIQWALFGDAQEPLVAETARGLSDAANLPYVLSFYITNVILNLMDKGVVCAISMIIINLLPAGLKEDFYAGRWKQRPLSSAKKGSIKKWAKDVKFSIRARTTITLLATSLLLVFITTFIGIRLYYGNEFNEKKVTGQRAAEFAASVIDADRVDDYLQYGKTVEGYTETEDMFYRIRENSPGVEYLYALRITEDGCYFVFDLDTDGEPGYAPGEQVDIEPGFVPLMPKLIAGEEIDSVQTNLSTWGRVVSTYVPVRDSKGRTVCYAASDVSMEFMFDFTMEIALKTILSLAGIFILVTSFALWATSAYTAYPVSTMAACVDGFASSGEDQERLDENVKTIRAIDIRTDDETEKLYKALCRMTANQAEQMRGIRRLSESTLKMQDGLIITMADMVESRDSDTGAHVQKTAAYSKIIVEGLKKKGYYAEKITPKFMSDVVRSAPLHDVGKINIPDEVLNKPGKLTDEEYAIMKTHTIAGKKILENAISTVQGESYLKEARNMAAYHHERWDGKGYPEGIHGEVIPLSARIMAVADVFDALTSKRIYKPPFPLEKALSILQEGAGTQFDPKCVEVFMEALPEVKAVLRKYNGQIV